MCKARRGWFPAGNTGNVDVNRRSHSIAHSPNQAPPPKPTKPTFPMIPTFIILLLAMVFFFAEESLQRFYIVVILFLILGVVVKIEEKLETNKQTQSR